MKDKVLIITHTREDNNCVKTVTRSLEKIGAEVVLFCVDKYPLEHQLSSTYANGKWEIYFNDGEVQHCLNDFKGIWNRKFNYFANCLRSEVDDKYLSHCINESKKTFFGLLRHLEQDVFFINNFSNLEIAESKELQLRIAADLGIKVPKTCFTNDPKVAKVFLEGCENGAISKMQHNFRVYDNGEETTLFTNTVSEASINQLDSLVYCPIQFQEKVAKQLELRIIIVGESTYAFAIDSQAHEAGQTDWRKVGAETINDWFPVEIPSELKEQLVQYCKHYGLNYGAADFILTPDNEYFFLEVNSAGEFFWIDEQLDYEISDHLAKLLAGMTKRNETNLSVNGIPQKERL